jgi:transcriptional regulator with GAF, ATPase, and Fis domain
VVGLIPFFLTEFNEKFKEKLVLRAEEFQKMLKSNWPGNARELRDYVGRLVVWNSKISNSPQKNRLQIGLQLTTLLKVI